MGAEMKKRRILIIALTLTLLVTMLVGIVGCDKKEETTTTRTLQSIKVIGKNEYFIEDFDFNKDFMVQQVFSDGSTSNVNINENMLGADKDKILESLNFMDDTDNVGKVKKSFAVTYKGKSASFTFNMVHKTIEEFPDLKEFAGVTLPSKEVTYVEKPAPQDKRYLEVAGLPENIGAKVVYRNNHNVNAGEHKVTAKISAPGYKTLELTSTFTIKPKVVAIPELLALDSDKGYLEGVVEYTGKRINAPIEKSNDYRISGDIAKYNAGKYSINVDLINDFNYVWDNGTTETIVLNWEIAKKKIDLSGVEWKYGPGMTKTGFFLYKEGTGTYTVTVTNYPRDLVVPKYITNEHDTSIRNVQKTNIVGDYTAQVSFSVVESKKANYEIDTTKPYPSEFKWAIKRNRINLSGEIQFSTVDESGNNIIDENGKMVFTYNGNPQRPTIINLDSVVSDATVSYKNEGHIDVGTYDIVIVITKEGYEPLELSTEYSIKPKTVKIPQIANKKLVCTGVEQHVTFVGNLGEMDGVIVLGITYGIEPNKYQLTYMLENTRNYVWEDGTTDAISNESNKWEICPIELPTGYEWTTSTENDNLIYDGKTHGVQLVGNLQGVKVTYKDNIFVNAGQYVANATLELTLPKEMYVNNAQGFVDTATYNWEIAPKSVDLSGVTWSNTSFIYKENITDTEYFVYLNLPNGVPEDLITYINDSTYCNKVLLKTETGVDVPKNEILKTRTAKVQFNSNYDYGDTFTAPLEMPWSVQENPIVGIAYKDTVVTYDPKGYKPIKPTDFGSGLLLDATIMYYPDASSDVVDANKLTFNVGTYKQRIVITKQGYTAYENTINFTINPCRIEKPVLAEGAENFIFNGKIQNCGIDTLEGRYIVKGTNSAFKVGTHKVTVSLQDVVTDNGKVVHNYIWLDNSEADIEYTWSIKPLRFDQNNVDWDYKTPFTYNGTSQQVRLVNLPNGIIAIYSTTLNNAPIEDAVNQGSYTTTVVLKTIFENDAELENQCYENVADIKGFTKTITWAINPKDIDVSGIRWSINDDKGPLIYEENRKGEAKTHNVKLVNIPTEIESMFIFEGTLSAKYANIPYEAVATFNNPSGNYNLIGCPTGDGVWKLNWQIKYNNLDWFYFENEYNYTFKLADGKSGVDGAEQMPDFVINHENAVQMREDILANKNAEYYRVEYLATDEDGNKYSTGPVTEVGTYKYLTRIYVQGYATKEQVVTVKIAPLQIEAPTVDRAKLPQFTGIYSVQYDKKEHSIPIVHPVEQNNVVKDYRWCYRMDDTSMTSVGEYNVRAELINKNFVWKGGSAEAYDLGFTWKITAPTASVMYSSNAPELYIEEKKQ